MHEIAVFKIFLLQKTLKLAVTGSWKPDQLLKPENSTGTQASYIHIGVLLNSL